MSETLKLYTFGGLVIQQGDVTITGFVSRKADALLVYLACNPQEQPRDRLAEMLWSDLSPDRAMGNLRTVLSSVQQRLSPYLSVTRQTVSLNPETTVQVDAGILDTEMDWVEKQGDYPHSLSRSTARHLERIVTMFKGDFLAGFNLRDSRGFEGWQTLERERLRGRIVEAQRSLVSHYLYTEQYSLGIAHALRILQTDPFWEEIHRQLMLLYARSGQHQTALMQYEACRVLLDEELGVEPEADTNTLYRQIADKKVIVTRQQKTRPHNLPLSATPYIDRPSEIAHVTDAIHDIRNRLVTIVGAGGSGKTRLALQIGALHLNDFDDGVFCVSLAPAQTADCILPAIFETLQIESGGQPDLKSALFAYLSDRQMLLILDNFDHVLADGTPIILELLACAPDLKLLLTSRERLNIPQEEIIVLGGMSYPDVAMLAGDSDAFSRYSAIQLFMQSARRLSSEFSFSANAGSILRICWLVQGMPLAIELAASRLRVMTCEQIATDLACNLDVLESPTRNIPDRHRSIRATFELSWARLNPSEQVLLQRLSVFQGSFHFPAAQQIAGATAGALIALCDKSLLNIDSNTFALPYLLRQFAAEKLDAEDTEAMRIKHAYHTYSFDPSL